MCEQNPNALPCDELSNWMKQWDAVHQIGFELFGLCEPETPAAIPVRARIEALINFQVKSTAGDVLSAQSQGQQQIQEVARHQLLFCAAHFAFLLDSLYLCKWFSLDIDSTRSNLNDLTDIRIQRVLDYLGENLPPRELLPAFALNKAIKQAADDLLLLHQIWGQYGPDQPSLVAAALQNGNQWAYQAWCVLAQEKYLPNSRPPITYIRTSASTRMTPYADRPLIGVPSAALALPMEFLSIPHELGHHLFWRGQHPGNSDDPALLFFKRVAQISRGTDGRVRNWAEEAFADIISVLLGGPAAAYALQNLMQAHVGNPLRIDDGHYPIPALRPFIGLRVCERLGWTDSHEMLSRRWCSHLEAAISPDWESEYLLDEQGKPVADCATVGTVRLLLGEFTDLLLGLFPFEDLASHAWTSDADDPEAWAQFGHTVPDDCTHEPNVDGSTTEALSWTARIAEALYQQETSDYGPKFAAVGDDNEEWYRYVLAYAANCMADPDLSEILLPSSPLPIAKEDWFAILFLGGWGDGGASAGVAHVT
ncbi:hypothetical protein GC175_30060 [bacterium]|nr:hypothetical protein [bacterium]